MNFVHPIRELEQIKEMKQELLKGGMRNYLLFTVGINSSFRISDLISLKVKDINNRTHIDIIAKKTGKRHYVNVENIQDEINSYCRNMQSDEYVFKSREKAKTETDGKYYRWHYNRKTVDGEIVIEREYKPYYLQPDVTGYLPIGRSQAEKIISDAAINIGIDYPVGTHTMRKTFAYHFYKKTKDIATLQLILGHDSPKQTLEYIGITQDMMDYAMANFKL